MKYLLIVAIVIALLASTSQAEGPPIYLCYSEPIHSYFAKMNVKQKPGSGSRSVYILVVILPFDGYKVELISVFYKSKKDIDLKEIPFAKLKSIEDNDDQSMAFLIDEKHYYKKNWVEMKLLINVNGKTLSEVMRFKCGYIYI